MIKNKHTRNLLAKHRRYKIAEKNKEVVKSSHVEVNAVNQYSIGNRGMGVRLKRQDVYGNGKPLHETLQEQKGQKTKVKAYRGSRLRPGIDLHKDVVKGLAHLYENREGKK